MASVLILQFIPNDGPAYLGTWLRERGIAADVRLAGRDGGFPDHLGDHQALALLGGSMSANDDLPFLRTAERLIHAAIDRQVPAIGHCLGGQLMARALGARVAASPAPEVGWQRMQCIDSPATLDWFGSAAVQHVFHWHYDAFELPPGALPLATSPACPHQAFALGEMHLGLQFHVEVDAAKVGAWLSEGEPRYLQAQGQHDSVHGEQRVRDDTARHLHQQQQLADRIYARWLKPTGILS